VGVPYAKIKGVLYQVIFPNFSNIPRLIQDHRRHFYGNGGAVDAAIEDIFEWIDLVKEGDVTARPNVRMYEFHRLENYRFIYQDLKLLKVKLDLIPEMCPSQIVGFLADGEGIRGYGWHDDAMHLMALNLVGDTVWDFGNGDKQKMTPGDLMFIPKGMYHEVKGDGIRFSVSICSPA